LPPPPLETKILAWSKKRMDFIHSALNQIGRAFNIEAGNRGPIIKGLKRKKGAARRSLNSYAPGKLGC
jgi:hypothetical protein